MRGPGDQVGQLVGGALEAGELVELGLPVFELLELGAVGGQRLHPLLQHRADLVETATRVLQSVRFAKAGPTAGVDGALESFEPDAGGDDLIELVVEVEAGAVIGELVGPLVVPSIWNFEYVPPDRIDIKSGGRSPFSNLDFGMLQVTGKKSSMSLQKVCSAHVPRDVMTYR